MNAMMRQTLPIGTARKAELPGWQAAGKTGTSQNFRDAWFVGYTGALVAGVWLGNDDGSSTKKVSGGNLPVEVWNRFMKTGAGAGRPRCRCPARPGVALRRDRATSRVDTPVASGPEGVVTGARQREARW